MDVIAAANELATHLAFALRELEGLRRQIATDRSLARFEQEHPNV